jgi:hypothetical protein
MKLMTKAVMNSLPALYSQEENTEQKAVLKFFTPDGNWTWYVIEGSPVDADDCYDTDKPKVDWMFFALVDGFDKELGYFSLFELQSIRGRLGLPVERDMYFDPQPISELMD